MAYRSLKKCFHDPSCDEKSIYSQRIHSDQCVRLSLMKENNPFFFLQNQEVNDLVYEILLLNSQCTALSQTVDNLNALLYTVLLEEIKQSNTIEGVNSSKKELFRSDLDYSIHHASRFSSQVRLYKNLLKPEQKFPQNSQEISELYHKMFLGTPLGIDKADIPDGKLFRKEEVFVGNDLKTIHQGLYPEEKIIVALDQCLHDLNGYNRLIQAGIFHFLFGYIHPFYDGNGRMGRYLTIRLLAQDLSLCGLLNFSLIVKQNRSEYYRNFELAEDPLNRGDLTPFLIMMLNLIKESMNRGIHMVKQTRENLQQTFLLIDTMSISKNKKAFLKLMAKTTLYGLIGLSQDEITKELNCSKPMVQKMVKEFETDLWREKDGRIWRYSLHRDFFNRVQSV